MTKVSKIGLKDAFSEIFFQIAYNYFFPIFTDKAECILKWGFFFTFLKSIGNCKVFQKQSDFGTASFHKASKNCHIVDLI